MLSLRRNNAETLSLVCLLTAATIFLMAAKQSDVLVSTKRAPVCEACTAAQVLPPKYNSTATMISRRAEIQNLCVMDKYRNVASSTHKSLISMDSKALIYCPVPKAGWSTWKRLFYREHNVEYLMNITNAGGFESIWDEANLKVVNNQNANNNFTNRMVFARNPYDRLVSAYLDRILHWRHSPVKKSVVPESPLTFPQLVQSLLSTSKKGLKTSPKSGYGGTLDYHYRPQTLLCSFCTMDFNIIGHLESMNDDITESLKVLKTAKTLPLQENPSEHNNLTLSYWYSQLSSEQLSGIQRLYAIDFELLGYRNEIPPG